MERRTSQWRLKKELAVAWRQQTGKAYVVRPCHPTPLPVRLAGLVETLAKLSKRNRLHFSPDAQPLLCGFL